MHNMGNGSQDPAESFFCLHPLQSSSEYLYAAGPVEVQIHCLIEELDWLMLWYHGQEAIPAHCEDPDMNPRSHIGLMTSVSARNMAKAKVSQCNGRLDNQLNEFPADSSVDLLFPRI